MLSRLAAYKALGQSLSVSVFLSLFFSCTHTEVIINEEREGMPSGPYAAVSPVAAEVPGSREFNLS